MEQEMIKIVIADDEDIVREGLKHIIDWRELGFYICGEAADGDEALAQINRYQPGVVLLDVRMPSMNGTELIQAAREEGFEGDFIFLSGYSDFTYAQTALQYGASYYLTKPINEEELEKAVLAVREKILHTHEKESNYNQYIEKARLAVIRDLLLGNKMQERMNYSELGLYASVYQVVIYCSYMPFYPAYDFAGLLRTANRDHIAFEEVSLGSRKVILLKGSYALDKFRNCIMHYERGTQKGSPLDSVFVVYGRTVSSIQDICLSYQDCRRLMERRFYCRPNQHVLAPEEISELTGEQGMDGKAMEAYRDRLLDSIWAKKRSLLFQTLEEMEQALASNNENEEKAKHFLIDIFLQVKQAVADRYPHISIPFAPNASIMALIEKKSYLFEIIQYFAEQTDMILRAVGESSNDVIFNDIVDYIDHNYDHSLRLEELASLFGYNASYLGKLFTKKMGKNFNAYLDEVRIRHAVRLLESTDLKIYEISARVGYGNVNYFYQKFHNIMGDSPSGYKRKS